MDRRYRSGAFARKTGVSVRTLRYYDQIGLLSPSCRTAAGYRLYTDDDLIRLQQVLALKFLGFSLEDVRTALHVAPQALQRVLSQQKAMLCEWRGRLDRIVRAIDGAEAQLQANRCDWQAIVEVIQAIQMEQDRSWTRKYFTEEQIKSMEELGAAAYPEPAQQKLSARREAMGGWTEEDQRRIAARYAALDAGVKRLAATGADPASPEAQALAEEAIRLVEEFTGGDPHVASGLARWWQLHAALPADKKPLPQRFTPEESEFLERAKAIARHS